MKDPLVSIIVPIYNSEKYLPETIQSVLNQSYASWEMICVDDCSQDNSKDIAKHYAANDSRIILVSLPENKGVAGARNEGLRLAKGDYVAFLDSDDIWHCDKLRRQVDFMRQENSVFSFTSYRLIGEDGSDLNREIHVPREVTYSSLLKGNQIPCFTVMLQRDIAESVRMPSVRHEDYATWLSILKRGYIAQGIDEVLGSYRVSSKSLSGNKIRSAIWTWNIYRKTENLPLLTALFLYLNYIRRAVTKYWF